MDASVASARGSSYEYRLSLLAAAALVSTILLILMGSLVRVLGFGLGCPDWPLCYGRIIPPLLIDAWFEFTHRVIGAVASILLVSLGVVGWRRYPDRPWLRVPSLAILILLVLQIPLGGLHVILEIPPLTGLIHTAFAMAIVGLAAVVFASAHPMTGHLEETADPFAKDRRFVTWTTVTMVVVYILLLTGSLVTRTGASLACPAFPWCGLEGDVPWTTQTALQMLHRYVAFTVAFLVLVLVWWIRQRAPHGGWRRYGNLLLIALLLQFTFGMLNVWLRLPFWSRALHLTIGATFWVLVVILWTMVWRRAHAT